MDQFVSGAEYFVGICVPIDAAADHVLKIVASGSSSVTLSVYVDGDFVCSNIDSSSTITSGNPGISVEGNSVTGNNFIDTWTDQ